jgi:hypothetical protein
MKKNLRLLLGLFWMACAMTGAIEILQGDLELSQTFIKSPAVPTVNLIPIFWSTALVAACWLLFGNEENNNTDK